MKFADPKNDLAFKKIFGDKNKTEVLISFLNSILDFTGRKVIKSVTIANPYQIAKLEGLKDTIVDVKALNQDDEEFIVEMQVETDILFAKRSLYYSSKSYVEQIEVAEKYPQLKKVYFIGILDFAIFDTPDYLSRHMILDVKTLKQEMKDFEFNFVELKKFKLDLSQCDTIAKKWIYFIQNASKFDMIPQEYENISEFITAFETVQRYKWKKEELDEYEKISMKKGVIKNGIKHAKEEGLKEGLEQGANEKALEIAKNSLDQGLDNSTVALITSLSLETIENLRE